MNEATKERRMAKAKLLLNRLKKQGTNGQLIFFSGKKNFCRTKRLTERTIDGCVPTSVRSPASWPPSSWPL